MYVFITNVSISKQKIINSISLTHTYIYTRALAAACPLLRRLDLSGNEITPEGMPAVAKALAK